MQQISKNSWIQIFMLILTLVLALPAAAQDETETPEHEATQCNHIADLMNEGDYEGTIDAFMQISEAIHSEQIRYWLDLYIERRHEQYSNYADVNVEAVLDAVEQGAEVQIGIRYKASGWTYENNVTEFVQLNWGGDWDFHSQFSSAFTEFTLNDEIDEWEIYPVGYDLSMGIAYTDEWEYRSLGDCATIGYSDEIYIPENFNAAEYREPEPEGTPEATLEAEGGETP